MSWAAEMRTVCVGDREGIARDDRAFEGRARLRGDQCESDRKCQKTGGQEGQGGMSLRIPIHQVGAQSRSGAAPVLPSLGLLCASFLGEHGSRASFAQRIAIIAHTFPWTGGAAMAQPWHGPSGDPPADEITEPHEKNHVTPAAATVPMSSAAWPFGRNPRQLEQELRILPRSRWRRAHESGEDGPSKGHDEGGLSEDLHGRAGH